MNSIDIHLCLVSKQPLPNLLPLLDQAVRPKRAVLLVSAGMTEQAAWLQDVLRGRGVTVETWPIDNAWDFDHVQTRVLELLEREALGQKRIALNATGGTKPMSIAAYEAFRAYALPVFYVHPERDEIVWFHPQGRPAHELADRIRLETFLQAHGARVTRTPQRNVPQAERLDIAAELVRNIDRYQNPIGTLNWLASQAQHDLASAPVPPKDGALRELIDQFAAHQLLAWEGDRIVFADESARFFANGGWLEYHVFDAVRQLRRADAHIQDVAFGIEVARQERGRKIPNELDVAFLRNNRLHIVECKTSKFRGRGEDAPGAEVVYKLDTLKDLLGGLQARAMLVSYRKIDRHVRARAADLGIAVCAGKDLQYLQDHLHRFIR